METQCEVSLPENEADAEERRKEECGESPFLRVPAWAEHI